MTTNEPGDPDLERSFRGLAGMKEEEYEDLNEGVKDCHTCYHSLELHRNGVSCGAIRSACTVKDCCRHSFPVGPGFGICRECGERRRELGRCGHYHPEGITCDLGARLIQEDFVRATREGRVMTVPDPPQLRVQLVVLKMNGTHRFYPMDKYGSWKINPTDRTLIIGKGMGRIIIPLETIDHISLENY